MNSTQPDRMLIVYNAEDGLFNALNDWAHKFLSPNTYECPLCGYTYGLKGMLMPWKNFITERPFPTDFLYRPFFWKKYPQFQSTPLPLILVEKAGRTTILLSAEEIKATGGLSGLIGLVGTRLEKDLPA